MQSLKQSVFLISLVVLTGPDLLSQESLNMSLLGRWDVDTLPTQGGIRYNDIWGWTDCSGREYAIVGSAAYIHFIDLYQTDQPVEVGRHPGSANSVWRDFKTYRDRAYAVADQGSDGLLIFDLNSLPDTIILENKITAHFTRSHNIYIDEENGLLYAVGVNTSSDVVIYDLKADPGNPQLVYNGSLFGGYIHDIHVRDNLAFASSGFNGLWVYDFSDPANPVVMGSLTQYPEGGYNHASWLTPDGQQLVFADETHGRSLKLTDVSQLDDIEVIALFKSALLAPAETGSIAHNPFVRDQYALISYYHDGVQVFDISNPDSIAQVAFYDTYPENQNYSGYEGNWGLYPYLPSGRLIATDISHGLFVLSADSISFSPIQPVLTPALSLASTTDTTLCSGDLLSLGLTGTADSLQWWRDGELLATGTDQYTISEAGQYWVTGQNGHCSGRTDTLEVEIAPLPDVGYTVSGEQFCSGDTVRIETNGTADAYQWLLDGEPVSEDTTGMLEVVQGGTYQFEAEEGLCTAASEPVFIEEIPLPEVFLEPSGSIGLCPGDTLQLEINSDAESLFLYVDLAGLGPVEAPVAIFEPGAYYVIAENGFCQTESEVLEVFQYEPIQPVIMEEDGVLTASPAVSYQWYRDGEPIEGADQQTFQVTKNGVYTVQTTDEDGCNALSDTVEVMVSDTGEAMGVSLRVYPQPAVDRIWVEAGTVMESIRLRDSRGRLLREISPRDTKAVFSVVDLPPGLYLLEVLSGKVRRIKKIVVR